MDSPDRDEPTAVSVTVVRTGGFAGIRREWTAQPAAPERPRWIALIRQCPWDDPGDPAAPAADRFTWRIDARLAGDDERHAELPETRLCGPWRDLVAEVQAFERQRPGRDDADSGDDAYSGESRGYRPESDDIS